MHYQYAIKFTDSTTSHVNVVSGASIPSIVEHCNNLYGIGFTASTDSSYGIIMNGSFVKVPELLEPGPSTGNGDLTTIEELIERKYIRRYTQMEMNVKVKDGLDTILKIMRDEHIEDMIMRDEVLGLQIAQCDVLKRFCFTWKDKVYESIDLDNFRNYMTRFAKEVMHWRVVNCRVKEINPDRKILVVEIKKNARFSNE